MKEIKIQICFVDDKPDTQRNFIDWSYIRKKETVDVSVRQLSDFIRKEIEKFSGYITPIDIFEDIIQSGLFPCFSNEYPAIKKITDIIFSYDNFEIKFATKLSDIDKNNDLFVYDVIGVLEGAANIPDVPFIIYTGYSDLGNRINPAILSHSKFLKAFTRSHDNFDLIMEGIENCARNNQIKSEYFGVISLNRLRSVALKLFLPLDIDMQALEILHNKKQNTPVDYLNEMYADNVNYLQKFVDLQYFVNGIDNGASEEAKMLSKGQSLDKMKALDKATLYHLSGITNPNIRQFFEMLDGKKNYDGVSRHKWGNSVKSFHDWYCKLAECLRSEQQ